MNTIYALALLFAALALVPAGAHVAELVNKMQLSAAEYRTVQQIYRGWALFGIVVFGALGSTLVLALRVRGHTGAFRPALIALLCIAGTQAIFWTFTFPVNQATNNWTTLPPDWASLRAQWEYSHAAAAVLNVAALTALIRSVLRYASPR
jgi:hypothetical protein